MDILHQYGPALLRGFGYTVLCWALGTVFAMALGLLIALLRHYGPRWLGWIIQVYIEVIRGTPFLVQLFVLYYGAPMLGLRLDAIARARRQSVQGDAATRRAAAPGVPGPNAPEPRALGPK